MNNQLLEVQHLLHSQGILISFSGRLSQALIVEYGEAVKKYLETDNLPQNEVFNIFSVFIEQTQNINNYCASQSENPHCDRISQSSIVTIGKTEAGNYVCSGNIVENEDIDKLTAYIESIVKLDKQGLKELYKAKLKQDLPPGGTVGAGLGLLEMARKATLPLQYSTVVLDSSLSFFTLKAIV